MVTTTHPCGSHLNLSIQFFECGCHHATSLKYSGEVRKAVEGSTIGLVGQLRGLVKGDLSRPVLLLTWHSSCKRHAHTRQEHCSTHKCDKFTQLRSISAQNLSVIISLSFRRISAQHLSVMKFTELEQRQAIMNHIAAS